MGNETEKKLMSFDFEAHRRTAVGEYAQRRPLYEAFITVVRNILRDAIQRKSLRITSIDARTKELESFGEKAVTRSERNPEEPKYKKPLDEIQDLAGVRVITFFPRSVEEVGECVREEFEVVEHIDHTAARQQEEKLGYLSVHYIVKLTEPRTRLPEYRRFEGLKAEVQVRTVIQHAWAEIEHDIQYKSSATIPQAIRRRFMSLAGLLEIADREFQAIQDDDTSLRIEARASVQEGRLEQVEITPSALRAYLDLRLGPDERMSDFSYEWTTQLLHRLGFSNLGQVEGCIAHFDDDVISRVVHGTRQGQLRRFELLLEAGMGEGFVNKHRWSEEKWFQEMAKKELQKLRDADIPIGSYDPASPLPG
jgi:putative GTP pyrophosphokinase